MPKQVEKVSYTKLTQAIMAIIRKYGKENPELEKDLYILIELIEKEENNASNIRAEFYSLLTKLP